MSFTGSILCYWNTTSSAWVPLGRCGSDGLVLNQISISMDNPDSITFTQINSPLPGRFRQGQWVNLTVDGVVVFIGQIVSLHPAGTNQGQISIGYRCFGLNWLINQLWITSPNGTGSITFNLPESDPNYVPSMSGQTVGQILSYLYNTMLPGFNTILNFPVGAFASMLFSSSDLSVLTIVPPNTITVTGRLWNSVIEILNQWYNTVGAWITPLGVGSLTAGGYFTQVQGTIRHENLQGGGFPTTTFTLDALDGNGIACTLDAISEDFSECYSQVVIRGAGNVQGANLSLAGGTTFPNSGSTSYPSSFPGTLVYGWSAGQQAAWTYNNYLNPSGATEQGTITSMTSTTLTVSGATPSPTYNTTTWWSSLNAEVWAYFPTGGSSFFNEQRRIVANTVPSGGGYTLTVDVPFANSGYTNYTIRGQTSFQGATTLADVWRKFYIVPQWVANSMVQQFSHSFPWSGGGGQAAVVQTITPMANVFFSQSTSAGAISIGWPMTFQIVPYGTGLYTTQATATATVSGGAVTGYAGLAGGSGYAPSTVLPVQVISNVGHGAVIFATTNSSGVVTSLTVQKGGTGYSTAPTLQIGVNSGYIEFYQPICTAYCSQSTLNGTGQVPNPTDLQVLVPYSRASLSVQAPTTGWQGTAYSVNGIQRRQYLDYPEWSDYGQASQYQLLANQKLLCVMNTVIEGSLTYFGKQSAFLLLGNAVNVAGNGYTTGYEAINAPARSVVLDYLPESGATQWITRINFSTRMKPFTGDRLYAHPNYLAQHDFPKGAALNVAAMMTSPYGAMVGAANPEWANQQFKAVEGVMGSEANQQAGRLAQSQRLPVAGDIDAMVGDGMADGIDGGGQMPAQVPRPVGASQVDRELQRQRRQERRENQRWAADMARAHREARGFDPSQSAAADAAEARRRERAALHTSEGSYNEARYGSSEELGLIEEETHS